MKFPVGSIVVMDRGYNDYKLFANLTNDNVVFVTRLKDNAVHTNTAKGVRAVDADGKWGDYQIQFTTKNALATGCVEYRPGLPNNVALKPSDLHLFLEFLQKFVAFSSVFIYY